MPDNLNHLFVAGFTDSQDFKSTLSVVRQQPPQRDRKSHGAYLLKQLAALSSEAAELEKRRQELELPRNVGMTIALEISPTSDATTGSPHDMASSTDNGIASHHDGRQKTSASA